MQLVELTEGKVRFYAPELELYSSGNKVEPSRAPVFYNPAMRTTRDVSVALIDAYALLTKKQEISVCEPLSATGVRGLRYAAEVEAVREVVLNDRNPLAYKLELMNAERNDLGNKVRAYNKEARALLFEFAERGEKFDIVDVDPFGTPAPFVEAALSALKHKGLLLVTATDLAPLFGVSPSSCRRKYFSKPLRSEFSQEVGARILAAFVVREAAKLGRAAIPVYALLSYHSLRLAHLVERSKSCARRAIDQVGYVMYCRQCLYREAAREASTGACPYCRGGLEVGGPLWLGQLWDPELSRLIVERYLARDYLNREGRKLVQLISSEAGKPLFYTTVTCVSKLMGEGSEPSPSEVVEELRRHGDSASLTHFNRKGFRTSLQPIEVARLLRGRRLPGDPNNFPSSSCL